jgi:hypothetical protein
MKTFKLALLSLIIAAAPMAAHAATCPDLSGPPNFAATAVCNFVITFNSNGSVTTGGPGGTYDGADDTLVGVINNTNAPISSFNLSSSTLDIFGFDGDGIDTYGAPGNSTDTSGYGGPDAYFTNINAFDTSGTVDFITAIAANGGTQYFSLEEAIDVTPGRQRTNWRWCSAGAKQLDSAWNRSSRNGWSCSSQAEGVKLLQLQIRKRPSPRAWAFSFCRALLRQPP